MLNPYFAGSSKASYGELTQHQNMITEAIQIYGMDVMYIPREDGKFDRLLGEDPVPTFRAAITIEMYLESNKGPDGPSDLFSKFGLDIRDSFTFTVSASRWGTAIAPYHEELRRPREGDLVFINFGNNWDPGLELFEIKWVEHEKPFVQLGRDLMYKLNVEKYRFSNENFMTGIPRLDNYKYLAGTDKQNFGIHMEDGSFMLAESDHKIIFDSPWQNDTAGENELGDQEFARRHGDNDALQQAASEIAEFNISNPFGEGF